MTTGVYTLVRKVAAFSGVNPFCPSSAFIRRAIELMHKHGVSVNGVTWTEGENADIHRKLWDLGFDHFTSDYPVFFSEFTKRQSSLSSLMDI